MIFKDCLNLVLSRYNQSPIPKVFIETGTFKGDTTASVSNLFRKIHTIELSEDYYNKATKRFHDQTHINCHFGDSTEMLIDLIPSINEPIIYYLDAHYSGGETAHGAEEVPLLRELTEINKRSFRDIIIIDDVRLFGKKGTSGCDGDPEWPSMEYNWRNITLNRILAIFNNKTIFFEIIKDRLVIFTNLNLKQKVFWLIRNQIERSVVKMTKKSPTLRRIKSYLIMSIKWLIKKIKLN